MKIKICRKEAKESAYWLSLLGLPEDNFVVLERDKLKQEATELTKIFGAILTKSIAKMKEG